MKLASLSSICRCNSRPSKILASPKRLNADRSRSRNPARESPIFAQCGRGPGRYFVDTLFASGQNGGGPESGAPVLDLGGWQPEIRDARHVRSESETEIMRQLAVLLQAEQHVPSGRRIQEIPVEACVPGGYGCSGRRLRPQPLGNLLWSQRPRRPSARQRQRMRQAPEGISQQSRREFPISLLRGQCLSQWPHRAGKSV